MGLKVQNLLNSYIKPKLMCFALWIYKSFVQLMHLLLNFFNIGLGKIR